MAQCIVVIPCFNEAQRLDERAFLERVTRHDEDFLFVNDGSSDATGPLLDDLCAANPASLSVLHLSENRGKAEAVRRGILQALSRAAWEHCRNNKVTYGYYELNCGSSQRRSRR